MTCPIVDDIIENNIDLVIADFSITAERLDIIDFSIPLATEGLTIFMRTPKAMDVTLFSFFLPYTSTVWTSLLAALIIGKKKSGAESFHLCQTLRYGGCLTFTSTIGL